VEITGSHEFSMKRVIFVGRWEKCGFDQKIDDFLKLREVFASFLGSFDVFPKGCRAAN